VNLRMRVTPSPKVGLRDGRWIRAQRGLISTMSLMVWRGMQKLPFWLALASCQHVLVDVVAFSIAILHRDVINMSTTREERRRRQVVKAGVPALHMTRIRGIFTLPLCRLRMNGKTLSLTRFRTPDQRRSA